MEGNLKPLPTVTSIMWRPTPELKVRWLRQYSKEKFTFEECRKAQTFPSWWLFPLKEHERWKWLAEAFPPKVAEHLFNTYVKGENLTLLDLFAGVGGWGLGAYYSGKLKKVIMIEKNKKKCEYLKENFSRLNIDFEVICEDVRNVDYSSLEKIDVITSSPPCEDLTVLKHFTRKQVKKTTRKGTIPLTLFTLELVEKLKPKIAFYENVYRKVLVELLKNRGWKVVRFDMSKIIPQKRVRLIAIWKPNMLMTSFLHFRK